MNHDRAHCIDFSPDCPESCFRAELTREALEKHWAIVDWSHFQGTEECKRMDDFVSRQYLLSEYDRQHQGPAGGARKIIENAPPAVTRCRECAAYDIDWTPTSDPSRHYCPIMDHFTAEDDFCSYGERKTE